MKMKKLKTYTDQRPFTIVYNDFLETDLLDWNEKRVFIILKKFADSNNQCFPSIKTLCKLSQLSKKTVIKALKGLEEKQIIIKQLRKNGQHGSQSNLYTLRDNVEMWKSKSVEELRIIAEESELEKSIRILKAAGYTVTKEKELDAAPTKEQNQAKIINQIDINNTTTNYEKNQDLEKYTIDQIKQLFDYDTMLQEHPDQRQDIDTVMDVLHTAMNTSKPTIRITGQDKPAMTVIGKLMKLNKESIMYAIQKFSEQTERVKNPAAYMLTILYNSPEQYYLDMKNQESSDMVKSDQSQIEKKTNSRNKDSNNGFANFQQRTYDYDKLEKELLKR